MFIRDYLPETSNDQDAKHHLETSFNVQNPNQDFKDIDVLFTFKSIFTAHIWSMGERKKGTIFQF